MSKFIILTHSLKIYINRQHAVLSHCLIYFSYMKVYSEVLGNENLSQEWKDKLAGADIDFVFLDQWTAQKSRFLGKGLSGKEYPIALARHTQIVDGDIVDYDPEKNTAVVLKIELSPVLVVDLGGLAASKPEDIIRISLELGHAIGNQHWPAVVKGTKVYVPLTVDKKVMLSVMETHHIEGITYDFQKGVEVIPYLAPHEIRRLFGGAGHESHSHEHDHGHIVYAEGHEHSHSHDHCHTHEHTHDGVTHSHEHTHDGEHSHQH